MAQLNQIIAVEQGVKARTAKEVTKLYREVGTSILLNGITRDYRPKDDDGDKLPSEATKVQLSASEVLDQAAASLTEFFDVTITKDTANQFAVADVVVDGQVIKAAVPATTLLFLEKQLNDVLTFVSKLPTLDPAKTWEYDPNAGHYRTPATESTRTKKIPKNHVRAEATNQHPAQVDVFYEDVIVGYWSTVNFSGALPVERVRQLITRVEKLQDAVKTARQEANTKEIEQIKIGESVFGYLFAP